MFGVAYPEAILGFLFGESFLPASATLRLLMLNVGVLHLRVAFDAPLTAWNRERRHAAVMVLTAVLNVGLNLWLIPDYGMEGAAIATLFSQFAALALFAVVHLRAAGGLPGLTLLKGLAAAVLAFAAASWVGVLGAGWSEIVLLIVGGCAVSVVFYPVALFLRLITWSEISQIFNR